MLLGRLPGTRLWRVPDAIRRSLGLILNIVGMLMNFRWALVVIMVFLELVLF